MVLGVRKFTAADTTSWEQLPGKRIFGGDLIEASSGYRMSAMFWRLGAGEQAEVPIPSDEVWIVHNGALAIRAGDDRVRAVAGEVLLVPRGSPGVAEIEVDTALLTVAHPPSWQIALHAAEPTPDGSRATLHAQRFTAAGPAGWEPVAGQDAQVAYPVGGVPGGGIGVGFGRFRGGTEFPLAGDPAPGYDQVVAVTSGAVTVTAAGTELVAYEGEFVYIPAGHPGVSGAAEQADAVLVRYPGTGPAG